MGRDVYVWQRAWTPGVVEAVTGHGGTFGEVVALGAQVWWTDGRPHVARVAVDWEALRRAGAAVGIAIRINPYAGAFAGRGGATDLLCDLAAELVAAGAVKGVPVAELQIDFDAAESKLEGYRVWVEAIRRRVATPVVITAVPSWLDAPGFEALARAAGQYVLQVHSVERPALAGDGGRMTLCDADAARRAVERAGRIAVPFRVALPTYGYAVAFENGKFLGLSAEGRSPAWPAGAVVRDVRAEAGEVAGLVAGWTADRPAALRGVIWYRLPVAGDTLNWRWPTLAAAIEGRVPRSALRAKSRRDGDGLTTIEVVNEGEADERIDFAVVASGGKVVSADALDGFERRDAAGGVRFVGAGGGRLGAGDRRVVGWVRTDRESEVVAHVER
jgi:hypothetical protein